MNRLALFLFSAAPFAAHAGLINEAPPVELEIQIWGTAAPNPCSCDPQPHPYTLTWGHVVTLYAPADSDDSPTRGDYTWDPAPPGRAQEFVTTWGVSSDIFGSDRIEVVDGLPGSGWDSFTVFNVSDRRPTGLTLVLEGLTISAPFDFIHGDGLTQSFDFSPAEVGGEVSWLAGSVSDALTTVRDAISGSLQEISALTIERVRVTPRSCRIQQG